VSDLPAADWIAGVFEAVCERARPARATAGPFGEKMARHRRLPAREVDASWLTYAATPPKELDPTGRLADVEGVEVRAVGSGTLIRLASTWTAYRRSAYWVGVEALQALLDRARPQASRYGAGVRQVSPRPTVVVPGVEVTRRADGEITGIRGTTLSRFRVGNVGLDTPGAVVKGFEVDGLQFDNVSLGPRDVRADPVLVRRCRLRRSRLQAVTFGPTIFDECVVDGLAGPFWPTALLLFRHVTLMGPIDSFDIRPPRQLSGTGAEILDRRLRTHYADVDWALDIREARFARCDLGGVPGHLVRRDPNTQVLVTTDRVLASDWRAVAGDTEWAVAIERLLEGGLGSEVFVACPRGDRLAESLAVFARLREAGIAEPD
jgi:hypothetical protein